MKRFVMAAAVIENILYFSDRFSNGLYQLDLDNGECTFIDYFYDEEEKAWLYFQAYIWGKKIYFIPYLAENIACFDIKSQEITYIELPKEGTVIHGVDGIFAEKFCCQKNENILWMMPVGYNLFLKLDLSNGQLSKVELPECLVFTEGILNWRTSSLYGTEMIFQPWAGTIQVRYDIVSGIFRLEELEGGTRRFRSCLKYRDYEIYVPWKLKNGLLINNVVYKKREILSFKFNVMNDTCAVSFLNENKIYLIPQIGQTIIVVNITDFSMEYIDLNEIFNRSETSWEWLDMRVGEESKSVFSNAISDILAIDRLNGNIKLIKVGKESDKSKNRRFRRCIENMNQKAFQEKREWILVDEKDGLEQLIVQAERYSKDRRTEFCSCGKRIYEKLKGELS